MDIVWRLRGRGDLVVDEVKLLCGDWCFVGSDEIGRRENGFLS